MLSDFPISEGCKYLPAAFEAGPYGLAKEVAIKCYFQQTYARFVLAVTRDVAQLVHFRLNVLNEMRRILAKMEGTTAETLHDMRKFSSADVAVNWCAVSLATDHYFAVRAGDYGWGPEDYMGVKSRWFDLLALAFLPDTKGKRIEAKVIREWTADFARLHILDSGPLPSCEACTSKCRYKTDVNCFLDHTERLQFEESLRRPEPIIATAAAVNLMSQRFYGASSIDFSYCFGVHLVKDQGLSAEEQIEFMEGVRNQLSAQA